MFKWSRINWKLFPLLSCYLICSAHVLKDWFWLIVQCLKTLSIGISMKVDYFGFFTLIKKKNRTICNSVLSILVRLHSLLFIKGIETKVFHSICLGKKKPWVKMVFSSLYITSLIINETRHDAYLDVINIVRIVFLTTFTASVLFYSSNVLKPTYGSLNQEDSPCISKIHLCVTLVWFLHA